jgi:hypothetical protein
MQAPLAQEEKEVPESNQMELRNDWIPTMDGERVTQDSDQFRIKTGDARTFVCPYGRKNKRPKGFGGHSNLNFATPADRGQFIGAQGIDQLDGIHDETATWHQGRAYEQSGNAEHFPPRPKANQ